MRGEYMIVDAALCGAWVILVLGAGFAVAWVVKKIGGSHELW